MNNYIALVHSSILFQCFIPSFYFTDSRQLKFYDILLFKTFHSAMAHIWTWSNSYNSLPSHPNLIHHKYFPCQIMCHAAVILLLSPRMGIHMPGYDMQYNTYAIIACTRFHTLHNIVTIHTSRWERAMAWFIIEINSSCSVLPDNFSNMACGTLTLVQDQC